MSYRCRVCGAWRPSDAERMPFPMQLAKLYPFLGYLHDAAVEYDRNSERTVSHELDLTSAAEFMEWLDYEVRQVAGVTQGRREGIVGELMREATT